MCKLDPLFWNTRTFLCACVLIVLHVFSSRDLEIPMNWVSSSNLAKCKNPGKSEHDGESNAAATDLTTYLKSLNVEENLSLLKFYLLSYRLVNQLLSGRDCGELDFIDHLTDQELEIVLSPRSIFMVGRSGSRKISVLTTKLFQKERQQYVASEEYYDKKSNTVMDISRKNKVGESTENTKEAKLRQIFVTANPKQCAAVKKHLSNLQRCV